MMHGRKNIKIQDRLPRNVGNYHCRLRNIAEERISHLHRGRNLKPRLGKVNLK